MNKERKSEENEKEKKEKEMEKGNDKENVREKDEDKDKDKDKDKGQDKSKNVSDSKWNTQMKEDKEIRDGKRIKTRHSPVLERTNDSSDSDRNQISLPTMHMIFFAGLRGAVAFACANIFPDTNGNR